MNNIDYNNIDDGMASEEDLLNRLKTKTEVFRNPLIEGAFRAIDRKDFVRLDYKVEAYEDYALPIGYGATISQPTVVAFMIELLDPKPGHIVLDLGSGSGFTTALLAYIVGEKGNVLGVEIVPELVEFGNKNLGKYEFKNAEIIHGVHGVQAYTDHLFDRILVSASMDEVPDALLMQLREGGIIVASVGNEIVKMVKKEDDEYDIARYPGFVFVPWQ